MASFKQLFDPCLRNINLIKLEEERPDHALLTLADLICMSKVLAFVLVRGSSDRSLSLIEQLRAFQKELNSTNTKSGQSGIKKFFGFKTLRKKNPVNIWALSTVIVDMDFVVEGDDSQLAAVIDKCRGPATFGMAPGISYIQKGRLLRALRISTAPSVILLDGSDLSLLTVHGYDMLNEKPDPTRFPWFDPSPSSIFQHELVRCSEVKGDPKFEQCGKLVDTVKAIYFGAKWCPPCKVFLKQLISVYNNIKEAGKEFEVVFCSFDRSKESFESHLSEMPWPAFPFNAQITKDVKNAVDVQGIPALVVLDKDNNIVSRHGKSVLFAPDAVASFPWKPNELYELNEFTVQRITELPSLIMFTEGTPEDSVFAQEVLRPCARILHAQLPTSESAASSLSSPGSGNTTDSEPADRPVPLHADPIQVFYTGEHPICDYILDSLGLGQMELPLLVICDTLTGFMAICDRPDVSDTTAVEFVNEYRSGRARVVALPRSTDKTVAGIPQNLLGQVLERRATTTQQPVST